MNQNTPKPLSSTDFMYESFGKRVKQQRSLLRWTQETLSQQAGISLSFLGHIERGTRKASLDTVVKLANALGVSPNLLLQDSLKDDLLDCPAPTSNKQRMLLREISRVIIDYDTSLPQDFNNLVPEYPEEE